MNELLSAVVRRRPRRATWLYGVIGALYIFLATWFLADMGPEIPRDLPRYWGLFVPLLVVLMQIAYPTVLGWALMLAGVAFYALAGLYYLIANNLVDRPAQWSRDPQGFGLGLIFVVVLIAIAAAMIRYRPRGAGETPRKEHHKDVRT